MAREEIPKGASESHCFHRAARHSTPFTRMADRLDRFTKDYSTTYIKRLYLC